MVWIEGATEHPQVNGEWNIAQRQGQKISETVSFTSRRSQMADPHSECRKGLDPVIRIFENLTKFG